MTSNEHQVPDLLRRLLRAKDRIDAASHEEWPVHRLARVSGVSEAHFARSFKQAFGVPPSSFQLGLFKPGSPLALNVDDCRAAYARMPESGVEFTQEPIERYGASALKKNGDDK